MEKPTKRFMKHGFLLPREYNQTIHNIIDSEENIEPIYQRNINYNTKPSSTFYNSDEIEEMKNEIKLAQCPICDEYICDDRCRVCQIGHKFHNFCYEEQKEQRIETTRCPTCRSTNIKQCYGNYNDTFSGGKIKKQKKKTRKQNKKTRKTKKKIKRTINRPYTSDILNAQFVGI